MIPLFGHDGAVAAFRDALDSGRLHHAWLISGPGGVGKGTFARAAALRLLADGAGPPPGGARLEVEAGHPTAKLFAAASHPDYRLVEREVWDSKGNIVPKHERSGNEELGRNIRVSQIRSMSALLSMRPSMSSRRAIVIDSADDLEPAAANALLKSLEEPPSGTIFLLVSHAPERLLPTIRSRCRHLRLSTLGGEAMTSALQSALPDLDDGEIEVLREAGEGAPGRAVALRGLQIDAMDRSLELLATKGDPTNARRSELAQSLALKSAQPRYQIFLRRAPSLIARSARQRSGPELAEAIGLWEKARELADSAVGLSLEPQSVVFELAGMVAALAPKELAR